MDIGFGTVNGKNKWHMVYEQMENIIMIRGIIKIKNSSDTNETDSDDMDEMVSYL